MHSNQSSDLDLQSSSIQEGSQCKSGDIQSSSIQEGSQCKSGDIQSSSIQEGSQCKSGDIQSSIQEGLQCQGWGCENEGSLPYKELPLSTDDKKASAFEERFCEDFALYEGEHDCETACSEGRDSDMEYPFGAAQSPDAKLKSLNLCSTSSTGSFASSLLEMIEPKSSGRPHSTLTDPNFVENYFKACHWSNCYFCIWCYIVGKFHICFSNLFLSLVVSTS
jgi:hypothetical protein